MYLSDNGNGTSPVNNLCQLRIGNYFRYVYRNSKTNSPAVSVYRLAQINWRKVKESNPHRYRWPRFQVSFAPRALPSGDGGGENRTLKPIYDYRFSKPTDSPVSAPPMMELLDDVFIYSSSDSVQGFVISPCETGFWHHKVVYFRSPAENMPIIIAGIWKDCESVDH